MEEVARLQQLFAQTSSAPPEVYAAQAAAAKPPRKKPKSAAVVIPDRIKIENIDLTGEDTRMDLSGLTGPVAAAVPPPPPTSPPSPAPAPAVPSFPAEVILEANDAKRTHEMLHRIAIQIPEMPLAPVPFTAPTALPPPQPLQPSPTTIMDETKESFPLATPEMKEWYNQQCRALMGDCLSVAALPINMNDVASDLQSARKGIRLLSELKHALRGHQIKDAMLEIEKNLGSWITRHYLFLRCRFAKSKEDKNAPFALIMLHRPYVEGEDRIQTQHYAALCALASRSGDLLKGIIYVNASEPYRPAMSQETERPDFGFIVQRLEALLERWTTEVWPADPPRHDSRVPSDKRLPICRVAYVCASMRHDGHVALLNQSSVYVPEYPPYFVDVVYTAG
jgi:hypothetical protein